MSIKFICDDGDTFPFLEDAEAHQAMLIAKLKDEIREVENEIALFQEALFHLNQKLDDYHS